MPDPVSRERLLETCFSEIPSKIGEIPLRPLSPGSFSLLGRIGCALMVATAGRGDEAMFDAVIEYVWVHSADLDVVLAVEKREDLPKAEIRKLGFQVTMPQAMQFLVAYKSVALRMAASLTEVEEDEEDEPGKLESAPAGLPALFLPSGALETPAGSGTSCGSSPSSGPSPISTLPTSPTEPFADGPAMSEAKGEILMVLPPLNLSTPPCAEVTSGASS